MAKGSWKLISGTTLEASKYVHYFKEISTLSLMITGILAKATSDTTGGDLRAVSKLFGWSGCSSYRTGIEKYRFWCHVSIWFSKCNQENTQTCVQLLLYYLGLLKVWASSRKPETSRVDLAPSTIICTHLPSLPYPCNGAIISLVFSTL